MRLFTGQHNNALDYLTPIELFSPADGKPRGKALSLPVSTATCPEHCPSMSVLCALITFPSRVVTQRGAYAEVSVYRRIIYGRSEEGITETVRFDDIWQLLLTMKLPKGITCPTRSAHQVTLTLHTCAGTSPMSRPSLSLLSRRWRACSHSH